MLDTAKLRAGIHGNLAAYRGGDLTVEVDRIIDAEELMRLAADELEELRRVRTATRVLCDRLREVHKDPRYVAVWATSQNHSGVYEGPFYVDELGVLEALL